jgi:hypothetical protein
MKLKLETRLAEIERRINAEREKKERKTGFDYERLFDGSVLRQLAKIS